MTLTPSYQQGFAPRDYEPLYPQLWRGCVGAWAPCLGATGTVLRDHSGYGNHGTLTNMDPGSDWVASGGKGALDFDGVDDNVLCYATPGRNDVSFGCWVKLSSTSQKGGFVKYGGNNGQGLGIGVGNTHFDNAGNNLIFLAEDVAWQPTTTPLGTDWVHVFLCISGSNWTTYLNGKELSSFSQFWFALSYGQELRIGGYDIRGFQRYPNCMIDDVRLYNRKVTTPEIRLLASERGIAYKQRRKRRFSQQAATGSRRLKLLTGLP